MTWPLKKNHHGRNKLEDCDIAFLEHLQAEAKTILGGFNCPEVARKTFENLEALYGDTPSVRKAHLYLCDRALLETVSPAELRAEAPGLYKRYCEEVGEAVDPTDPTMKRPTPGMPEDKAEVDTLRARVLQIVRALHWSYTFGPLREKNRVRLIVEAMVVMIIATGALAATLGILRQLRADQGQPFFAVLATVIYVGVMGGVVSCIQRLSQIPTSGDALRSIYELKNSRYVLYFAPLTGAVFAVITMLLFMGQILKGLIFPVFPELTTQVPITGDWSFTRSLLPAGSKDYALLFLWCFIAGFAERFIPDTLTDLTQRATALGRRERPSTITETVVTQPAARRESPHAPAAPSEEISNRRAAPESGSSAPAPPEKEKETENAPPDSVTSGATPAQPQTTAEATADSSPVAPVVHKNAEVVTTGKNR
jgi:hypothetical protein